jgi:uncharacterized membrane protein YbaN (DUF454 family)
MATDIQITTVTGLRRGVYLLVAGIAFVLGMVGVVLPGLPTTPFLLLTSYLLMRSWPTLNERMLRSPFIGSLLRDWHEHRGVRQHMKVRGIVLIVGMLTLSIWLGDFPLPIAGGILACGCVGLAVVMRLPTISE